MKWCLLLGLASAAPKLDGLAQGVLANLTPRQRLDLKHAEAMRNFDKEAVRNRHLVPLLPLVPLPSIRWPELPSQNDTVNYLLKKLKSPFRTLDELADLGGLDFNDEALRMHYEVERMYHTENLPPFQALLDGAKQRTMMDPPLAPSFERLQSLVDDVSRDRKDDSGDKKNDTNKDLLPCLLQRTGCHKEDLSPKKVKENSETDTHLEKTQTSIEQAVTQLQKDLDMRTAEVVKEIERRAAEMRRQIALEAEELIEAVKYLVTMLADSVTRADEMGEGFVREWFDEAKQRYVGDQNAKPLDEDIEKLNDDLKRDNKDAHKDMVKDLKEHVKKTREKYGQPQNSNLSLDEELGLVDEQSAETTAETDEQTEKQAEPEQTEKQAEPERTEKQAEPEQTEKQAEKAESEKTESHTEAEKSAEPEKKEEKPKRKHNVRHAIFPFGESKQNDSESKQNDSESKENDSETDGDTTELVKEMQAFGLF